MVFPNRYLQEDLKRSFYASSVTNYFVRFTIKEINNTVYFFFDYIFPIFML